MSTYPATTVKVVSCIKMHQIANNILDSRTEASVTDHMRI